MYFGRIIFVFALLFAGAPENAYAQTAAGSQTTSSTEPLDELIIQAEEELRLKNPERALSIYQSVIAQSSESEYAAKAYAGISRCQSELLNPEGIREAVNTLEVQFPTSPHYLAAILVEGDFANSRSGDANRSLISYQTLIKISPNSLGAAAARIRLADLKITGRFDSAIEEYQKILADFPNLPLSQQAWCVCQIGVCHYQLGQFEEAKRAFEHTLSFGDTQKAQTKEIATLHLTAISNPQGIEGLKAQYDKAIRFRSVRGQRDNAYRVFSSFIRQCSESPEYEKYCSDPNVAIGERAQMRYRLAFAMFNAGFHNESLEALKLARAELAKNTLTEKTYLEKVTAQQCDFFDAFHCLHCGHWENSANKFRALLDNPERHGSLIPTAYKNLATALEEDKDPLGAALACEEFIILYPYRAEVKDFRQRRGRVASTYPKQMAKYEEKRAELMARLSKDWKTPVLLADGILTSKPDAVAMNVGPAEGGTEK